ncbi:MAG: hypothetical protein ABSC13_07105 [Dehalococcoidia bacterium]
MTHQQGPVGSRIRAALAGVIVLAALISAAVAVGTVLREARATPASGVTLKSVSSAALAEVGITLSAPPANATAIARSAAESSVQAEIPGATVREGVLAIVDDIHANPAIHCLCWVMSITPPGGIKFPSAGPFGTGARATPSPPTFLLFMFDAATGAFVEGTSGN